MCLIQWRVDITIPSFRIFSPAVTFASMDWEMEEDMLNSKFLALESFTMYDIEKIYLSLHSILQNFAVNIFDR